MSKATRDGAAITARQVFEAHIRRQHGLEDIGQLGARLPRERTVLQSLQAVCMAESRKALEAGHHTEGRRLGTLARQLRKLAEGLA